MLRGVRHRDSRSASGRSGSGEAMPGRRGLVYRMRVAAAVGAVFLVCGCAALVGGLLDMFAPSLTIRWQLRSTASHGGTRRAVGTGFQVALRIDPDADPWNDTGVKRKVRWIGAGLSLFGIAVVILGIWLLASAT